MIECLFIQQRKLICFQAQIKGPIFMTNEVEKKWEERGKNLRRIQKLIGITRVTGWYCLEKYIHIQLLSVLLMGHQSTLTLVC